MHYLHGIRVPVEIVQLLIDDHEEGNMPGDGERKVKSIDVRVATLYVGTMTGKGREIADMAQRRNVDVLPVCVQETKWNGSKVDSFGARFQLVCHGVDKKRIGEGKKSLQGMYR